MPTYSVRYVHPISPRDTDTGPDVEIPPEATIPPRVTYTVHGTGRVVDCTRNILDRKEIGRILRAAGVLWKGARVREARIESDGRIVVFMLVTGCHAAILTPKAE